MTDQTPMQRVLQMTQIASDMLLRASRSYTETIRYDEADCDAICVANDLEAAMNSLGRRQALQEMQEIGESIELAQRLKEMTRRRDAWRDRYHSLLPKPQHKGDQ